MQAVTQPWTGQRRQHEGRLGYWNRYLQRRDFKSFGISAFLGVWPCLAATTFLLRVLVVALAESRRFRHGQFPSLPAPKPARCTAIPLPTSSDKPHELADLASPSAAPTSLAPTNVLTYPNQLNHNGLPLRSKRSSISTAPVSWAPAVHNVRRTPARRFASLTPGPLSALPGAFGRVGMPASASVVDESPDVHVQRVFGFRRFDLSVASSMNRRGKMQG